MLTLALLQTENSTQFFRTMYHVYEAKFQEPCTTFCFINIVHGAEKSMYYLLLAIQLQMANLGWVSISIGNRPYLCLSIPPLFHSIAGVAKDATYTVLQKSFPNFFCIK